MYILYIIIGIPFVATSYVCWPKRLSHCSAYICRTLPSCGCPDTKQCVEKLPATRQIDENQWVAALPYGLPPLVRRIMPYYCR